MADGLTYTMSYPLTEYAASWYGTQVNDPASFLAPNVQAGGYVGTFKRYDRASAFGVEDTKRALYNAPRTIDIKGEDIPFLLEEHALRIGIDDRELRGVVAPGFKNQLQLNKTKALLQKFLRSHNKRVFDTVNKLLADSMQNVTWSSGNPDIIGQIKNISKKFQRDNGVYLSRILTTMDVWDDIEKSPQMQERIQYTETKTLTIARFLEIVGLTGEDIPPVSVMRSGLSYNKNQPGVEADNADLVGRKMYLFFAEETPSMEDLSAVKTLTLSEGGNLFGAVKTAREETVSTDWIQTMNDSQIVVAAPSCIVALDVA